MSLPEDENSVIEMNDEEDSIMLENANEPEKTTFCGFESVEEFTKVRIFMRQFDLKFHFLL